MAAPPGAPRHFLVMDFEATCDSDEVAVAGALAGGAVSAPGHRLATGDAVQCWTSTRNCTGGWPLSCGRRDVTDGTVFFVRAVDGDVLRLYRSELEACEDRGALPLDEGSGANTVLKDCSTTRRVEGVAPGALLRVPGHRLCTGNRATWKRGPGGGGGLSAAGRELPDGSELFVRATDPDTLKLFRSKAAAERDEQPLVLDEGSGAGSLLQVAPRMQWVNEIIEFPCVLVDAATLEVVAEFRRMVRPTLTPIITRFCTSLTSITEEQVAAAPTLDVVLAEFKAWLREVGAEDGLPVTCGDWDLKTMLPSEARQKGLAGRVPPALRRWCNIKRPFAAAFGAKSMGMAGMLKALKLDLVGRHHLGIDDARNIARILQELVRQRGSTIVATGWQQDAAAGAGGRR